MNSFKEFLAKRWGAMTQLDMRSRTRDVRMGEQRMNQIITARLWLSWNDTLHSQQQQPQENIWSAETTEIL